MNKEIMAEIEDFYLEKELEAIKLGVIGDQELNEGFTPLETRGETANAYSEV